MMIPEIRSNLLLPARGEYVTDKNLLVKNTKMVYNIEIPKLSRDYPIKYIQVPDMHYLLNEPGNRKGGHIARTEQIIDELCFIMVANGINGVIFSGDIANAGETTSSLDKEVHRLNKIIKIVRCADNNGYSVFGNHEETYSHNNPFYAISSIDSDKLKKETVGLKKPELLYPFIRTPEMLDFGVARVYLMHFQKKKSDKLYRIMDERPNNAAIYHDDLITFESKMELYHHRIGHGINISNSDIFDYVDWAIFGHIHMPLETLTLTNTRNTTIDCPGSLLGRTVAERHERVKLPVICIDERGLHKEYLTIEIGAFKETIDEEKVSEERAKRAMAKIMKQEKADVGAVVDYHDLLGEIRNKNVRQFIEEAVNPINLESREMLQAWYHNKYGGQGVSTDDDDEDNYDDTTDIV